MTLPKVPGHDIKKISPAGMLVCGCGEKIECTKEQFLELKREQIVDALLDRHAAHIAAKLKR